MPYGRASTATAAAFFHAPAVSRLLSMPYARVNRASWPYTLPAMGIILISCLLCADLQSCYAFDLVVLG